MSETHDAYHDAKMLKHAISVALQQFTDGRLAWTPDEKADMLRLRNEIDEAIAGHSGSTWRGRIFALASLNPDELAKEIAVALERWPDENAGDVEVIAAIIKERIGR